MDFEAGRQALVTRVQALAQTWTGYSVVIQYDNTAEDPAPQAQPYLCVSLDFKDGYQANLGPSPVHRALGVISLSAVVKAGAGRKAADQLLAHFIAGLQMTDGMPPLRTRAVIPLTMVSDKARNLVRFPVAIPFWMDSFT